QVEDSAGEDCARPVAPVACLPVRAPTQAPPRSTGTRYSNRAHWFPATSASIGAGPPAEAPAAAPVVETRLAASGHRNKRPRTAPEPPDARAPNAPPRPAQFPPAHPCVRSRPRQIPLRSSAADDAARDYEGRQYHDWRNPHASSGLARAKSPAMQRGGSPAAAAPTRQTRAPALRK